MGPVGIGTFDVEASFHVPVTIAVGGRYWLKLTYIQTAERRRLSIYVDGKAPAAAWTT